MSDQIASEIIEELCLRVCASDLDTSQSVKSQSSAVPIGCAWDSAASDLRCLSKEIA